MSEAPTPTPGANGETPAPSPAAIIYTKEMQDTAAAHARKESEGKLKVSEDRLAVLEAQEEERKTAEMSELEKVQSERDTYKTDLETEQATSKTHKDKLDAIDLLETEKVEKALDGLTDPQKDIVNSIDLHKRMGAIAEFKLIKPGGITGGGKTNGAPNGLLTTEEIFGLRATDPIKAGLEYKKRKDAGY